MRPPAFPQGPSGPQDDPADDRGTAILSMIRSTFAEKGFDGTSMQDLARAAGISVGNFYRYFPSKAAIVEALISRDMEVLEQGFALIHAAPDPVAAAREMFRAQITQATTTDCQIWAEVTSTALRKPEIAALAQQMHERLVQHLVTICARAANIPATIAAEKFRPQAELILLLVKGSNINRSFSGPHHTELVALLSGIVDRMMDDLTPSRNAAPAGATIGHAAHGRD